MGSDCVLVADCSAEDTVHRRDEDAYDGDAMVQMLLTSIVLKYVRSRGFAFWSHGVYKATEARLSMSGGGIESGESGGGAVHSQWSRKFRKSSSRVSQ